MRKIVSSFSPYLLRLLLTVFAIVHTAVGNPQASGGINLTGTWLDGFGYTSTLVQDQFGNISGSLNNLNPNCDPLWPVAGNVTGSTQFQMTATNPRTDHVCAAYYTYVMTMQPGNSYATGQVFYPGGDAQMTMTLVSPALFIVAPTDNENDVLDQSNETATSKIQFQAQAPSAPSGTQVNWTLMLQYSTSGGVKVPSIPKTFTTTTDGRKAIQTIAFASRGGQLTSNANATISGSVVNAPQVQSVITGLAIPSDQITAQLTSLYGGGATPNLMTGIAEVESTYLQFVHRVLYGISADWPVESYDGGSHIGLMQMPTRSMGVAFDWLSNTKAGVNLFGNKIVSAQNLMNRIVAQHSGLRVLSPTELENMALVLYGPYASASLSKQYYVPVQQNGVWVWIVNTSGNANGVMYADDVRSSVQ